MATEIPVELEALSTVLAHPQLISYVVMAERVGVRRFVVELEWTHFNPKTELNTQFQFLKLQWPPEAPMLYYIVTVPQEYKTMVDWVANKNGLSIEPPGSVIMSLSPTGGQQTFPIAGPNIYLLKNKRYSSEYAHIEQQKDAIEEDAYCTKVVQEYSAKGRNYTRFRPRNLATIDDRVGSMVMKVMKQKEFIISSDREPEEILRDIIREGFVPSKIDAFTLLAKVREESLRLTPEHFGGINVADDRNDGEALTACELLGKLGYTDGAATVNCSGRRLDDLLNVKLRTAAQTGRMLILDEVESRDRKGDEQFKDVWDFIRGLKNSCDLLRRDDIATGFFVVAISYDSAPDETFSGRVP